MALRYTKTVLSNGLRVLFTPLVQTEAVTVLMLTKVGSRYEPAAINGVSHFLEHMMFKGTEKRPTARDVSKELDRVGADFNAFTAKDNTGYYIKLAGGHLPLALDIMADMLWHSKFAEDEIAKERNVIIEEINMYLDNPVMLLEDAFEETVFGRNHPLGRNIAGTKDVIQRMRRSSIVQYFHSHYSPRNMVLSIAGNFQPRPTLSLVKKLFGNVEHRRRPTSFPAFRPYQRRPQVRIQYRKTQQVQLGLGFPALPYDHRDQPALAVLAAVLGGNMSSRLFTRVREQEGLCYHISASRSPYQDTGTFFVRAGLDRSRLVAALRLIVSILNDVKENGVTSDELSHAKEFLKGKFTLALEDSEEIADFFAKQELLTHRIRTPSERLKELARVTLSDVHRIARAILVPSQTNLALIGPFRSESEFTPVLRHWPKV